MEPELLWSSVRLVDNLRADCLVGIDEVGPGPAVVHLEMEGSALETLGLVGYGFVSHGRDGRGVGEKLSGRSTEKACLRDGIGSAFLEVNQKAAMG